MRMRLGLLQDPAVIDRQIAKEVKAAEAARRQSQAPTVKTEAETIAEENMTKQEREAAKKKVEAAHRPRIRPLSEAKAIETGANFISETFIFAVAVAVIVFEQWRQRRKAQNQRDDIREDLEELRVELDTVKTQLAEMKSRYPESNRGLLGMLKGKSAVNKTEEESQVEKSAAPAQDATPPSTTLLSESENSNAQQPESNGSWLSFFGWNSGAQKIEPTLGTENDTTPEEKKPYETQPPSNPPIAASPADRK